MRADPAPAARGERGEGSPALAVALAAGVLGAVQPKINAVLGDRLASAVLASLVNFGVAALVVVVALALRPATRARLRDVRRWPVPRWTFAAGLGGVLVVLAGAIAVDTIGVAIFSVAFFGGQVTAGLAADRLGLAPGGRRPVTARRLQAVGLAVVAVVVAQVGREGGDFEPAVVLLVVAGGAAVSLQSACNARITSATADPVAATAVNMTVGTLALVTIVLGLVGTGELGPVRWPGEPWLYLGGVLGVTIVLSLAVATAAVGVLRATLGLLGAQLVAAFLVDWVVEGDPPTIGAVAGAVLIVAAVVLVGRSRTAAPPEPAGSPGPGGGRTGP